jgi:hypothetical protein
MAMANFWLHSTSPSWFQAARLGSAGDGSDQRALGYSLLAVCDETRPWRLACSPLHTCSDSPDAKEALGCCRVASLTEVNQREVVGPPVGGGFTRHNINSTRHLPGIRLPHDSLPRPAVTTPRTNSVHAYSHAWSPANGDLSGSGCGNRRDDQIVRRRRPRRRPRRFEIDCRPLRDRVVAYLGEHLAPQSRDVRGAGCSDRPSQSWDRCITCRDDARTTTGRRPMSGSSPHQICPTVDLVARLRILEGHHVAGRRTEGGAAAPDTASYLDRRHGQERLPTILLARCPEPGADPAQAAPQRACRTTRAARGPAIADRGA